MVERLGNVLSQLKQGEGQKQYQVMVGFDGYIDNLVCPVKVLRDDGNTEFFDTIAEFGGFITGKANKSCCIELHPVMKKIGGNTPIFGKAIAALGIPTKCIGAFGYPKVDELFQEKEENLEIISVANPGYCTALEFGDGKVMLADNQGIKELDYPMLRMRLDAKRLMEIMSSSNVISLMNWSEVVGSASIWEGILTDILPNIDLPEQKKIFIDISDCSDRSGTDIHGLVELILKLSGFCKVVLSLNRNEFEHLIHKLKYGGDIREQMRELKYRCGLFYLVIHDQDGAYVMESEDVIFLENKYNSQPQILTGGGDNFNAGLVYGMIMGMSLEEAVLVGNAVSSYYVTYAKSPDLNQLKAYMLQWWKDMEQNARERNNSRKLQNMI